MTKEQVVLAALTAVFIPALIAETRYRWKMAQRITKIEEFNGFISTFLLKNAVLEFHNNPNPKTDRIIEKINHDEPLTMDEMKQLKEKLKTVAGGAGDAKKQFKARNALELMRFMEDFQESTKARSRARNELFAE